MKKLLCMLLLTVLLMSAAVAETRATRTDLAGPATQTDLSGVATQTDLAALYRAKMAKAAKMRQEPDTKSRFIVQVPDGAVVEIIRWGEKWSYCRYGSRTGYLLTDRMYELWRLGDEPLPGMVYTTGVARFEAPMHLEITDKSSGDLFTGNDLTGGELIAAIDAAGRVPFRRGEVQLAAGTFTFLPFAAPQSARPGDLLYAFTTYYNDKVGGNLADERIHNIELAVERLTGTVLAPGEQFSFNALCGPYSKANGYLNAPNISRSGFGVGGGVCQVSTTIFEAVLGLELRLDQWEVHQTSGVKYAPVNFDAAVGSRKDLRFTNSLPYPIRLEVLTQNGAMTAFFYRADDN